MDKSLARRIRHRFTVHDITHRIPKLELLSLGFGIKLLRLDSSISPVAGGRNPSLSAEKYFVRSGSQG
jgi:hypothetical protein